MKQKREFILDGLCCPNCAAKIEGEVRSLPEVAEASLNLINNKLSVTIKESGINDIADTVKTIVKAHEPSVKVRDLANKTDKVEGTIKEQENDRDNIRGYIFRLSLSLVMVVLAYVLKLTGSIRLIALIIAYLLSGYEILMSAIGNIRKGRIFDENFLMGFASLGALVIGEELEAVTVLIFYGIGELLQDLAVKSSRKNIAGLMDIRPDYANLVTGAGTRTVSPEQVSIGDLILVKPGEKIPLDGIVVKGYSYIDTRALTGESMPREVTVSDEVLSGTINTSGLLEISVTKSFGDSTVSRILELVENSGSKKAESEKFITKFARYYTPIVVFTAVGVALLPPLFGVGAFSLWIYRALSFLIISCPCALVISIPLSFFGGIGGAARQGILIKGGNFLDALHQVDTVVFDKTGTLTRGVFKVSGLYPSQGISQQELLRFAVAAESSSGHPIAKSILDYYNETEQGYSDQRIIIPGSGDSILLDEALRTCEVTEKAGFGMMARLTIGTIYAGNEKLMNMIHLNAAKPAQTGSVVHIAWENQYLGYILISDEIKQNVKKEIARLKQAGVRFIVMLTGDHKEAAGEIAGECGVDEYHAELLPQDKVSVFGSYQISKPGKGKTVFVGDGINDAPVLAAADIGIAMGGIGSDAAIEAADIVIMNDDIGKITTAIKVARKTRNIVIQNIIFALGVKILIMALAFFGITSIWFAIFADVGVSLLALCNALRVMQL